MAMVMNVAQLPEKQQTMAPKIINALFGCPGRAFITQAEARQWLNQLLSPYGA
jgi:hypothetical protein